MKNSHFNLALFLTLGLGACNLGDDGILGSNFDPDLSVNQVVVEELNDGDNDSTEVGISPVLFEYDGTSYTMEDSEGYPLVVAGALVDIDLNGQRVVTNLDVRGNYSTDQNEVLFTVDSVNDDDVIGITIRKADGDKLYYEAVLSSANDVAASASTSVSTAFETCVDIDDHTNGDASTTADSYWICSDELGTHTFAFYADGTGLHNGTDYLEWEETNCSEVTSYVSGKENDLIFTNIQISSDEMSATYDYHYDGDITTTSATCSLVLME